MKQIKEQLREAIKEYLQGAREKMLSLISQVQDINYLFTLATKDFFDEYEVAVPLLNRILEIDPDNIEAMNTLITLYSMYGEDTNAKQILDLMKKKYPEHPLTLFSEYTLTDSREVTKRVKLLKNILKNKEIEKWHNIHFAAVTNLALQYVNKKDYLKAQEYYQKALQIAQDEKEEKEVKISLAKVEEKLAKSS